jgi:folate-dependent phosphoribosylglycinamide formyltransferase PurN
MTEREPYRVLILGSGQGTTADAYAEQIHEYPENFNHEIVGVVSSKADAPILDKAASWQERFGFHVPTFVVNNRLYPGQPNERGLTGEASAEIDAIASSRRADLICAMGFMLIINEPLLRRDILNWHPGILPQTANTMGEKASMKALEFYRLDPSHPDHIDYTVASVHLVTADVDSHLAVIAEDENRVDIFPDDNYSVLNERVQNKERARAADNIDHFRRNRDHYRGLLRVIESDPKSHENPAR